MATITYNGLTIRNCKINRFNIENEFEGENFNRTGRKQTLEGVGIIVSTDFSTDAQAIKNTLSVPGKKLNLTFTTGGAASYDLADGYDGSTTSIRDARNGPFPACNVTEVIGTSNSLTFVIGFSFVWNDGSASPIQRVELITTSSINEDGILRVTRRGYIRISAANTGPSTIDGAVSYGSETSPFNRSIIPSGLAVASAPPNADLYRRLVAGPPAAGFQRTKQEFYVQADQTTLAFDIEDLQLVNSLPTDILNGDGSFEYERSIDKPLGTKLFRIELTGSPKEDRKNIFVRCLDVAMTRIRFVGDDHDLIQSIKVTEPSLFKKNTVGLEITAYGSSINTASASGDLGDTKDWIYKVLFADPTVPDSKTTAVDPYGAFKTSDSAIPIHTNFRYDPIALSNTWVTIAGTAAATAVTATGLPPSAETPADPPEGTAALESTADSHLEAQAKYIVKARSFQTVDIVTNIDLFDAMGGDVQTAFQFAMPYAMVHQTVDMVTRSKDVAIAWPVFNEQYVVMSMNVTVNDAPPDASGNRTYAIHAIRTLRVNVATSTDAWFSGGASSGSGSQFAAGGGEKSARLINYLPSSLMTGRNPIVGSAAVDVRANVAGTLVKQAYSSGPPST